MIALAPEDLADLRRWAICAAVVLLAHGAIAGAMVTWHEDEGGAEPASAIVVEMAPVPVASHTPQESPPGPLQEASVASPNKPTETEEDKQKTEQKVEAKLEQKTEEKIETKPPEEPPPEVSPALNPEVAIAPTPPQEVKQEESVRRQSPSLPSTASAPQVIAEQTAAIAAAPTQDQVKPDDAKAAVAWQMQVAAALKKNLRYPAAADRRGQSGMVRVSFELDQQGHVLDSRVVRGSGIAELDEEALAVVKRSQPFQAPPPSMRGKPLTVPISFVRAGAAAEKR